jgi:hypothetical protein
LQVRLCTSTSEGESAGSEQEVCSAAFVMLVDVHLLCEEDEQEEQLQSSCGKMFQIEWYFGDGKSSGQ